MGMVQTNPPRGGGDRITLGGGIARGGGVGTAGLDPSAGPPTPAPGSPHYPWLQYRRKPVPVQDPGLPEKRANAVEQCNRQEYRRMQGVEAYRWEEELPHGVPQRVLNIIQRSAKNLSTIFPTIRRGHSALESVLLVDFWRTYDDAHTYTHKYLHTVWARHESEFICDAHGF